MRDSAVITADFTALPVGFQIGRNTIQICPECEKPGIFSEWYGVKFYVHAEWQGFDENGERMIGWNDHVIRPENKEVSRE